MSLPLFGYGRCPQCRKATSFDDEACGNCGFPFSCDITQSSSAPLRRSTPWPLRLLIAVAVFFFAFTSGSIVGGGYEAYNGLTHELATSVRPVTDSGIHIHGPQDFIHRTQLVLGLLKLRAPDFYWRVQDSVVSIGYMDVRSMQLDDGRHVSLHGIGAMAQPGSGEVTIMSDTVYPNGMGELYDYDLFSFAGTLVHELRHIELHAQGMAPGGWEEEYLCEEAAYAAVKQMQAPPSVLARYQVYLADPKNQRYQHWYDWYKQF